MPRAAILLVLLLLGAACAKKAPASDAPTTAAGDLALLQGRWLLASFERDGLVMSGRQMPVRVITFRDSTFQWNDGDESGTLKLDPLSRPKHVDYTDGDGAGRQGPVYFGLYELHGNSYRDCFVKPGDPRPTELVTRKGDGVTCISYVRTSPLGE